MKIRKTSRIATADSLDIHALEDLVRTPGYKMLRDEVDKWIRDYDRQLRTCSVDELQVIQSRIALLQRVQEAPQALAAKIAGKAR